MKDDSNPALNLEREVRVRLLAVERATAAYERRMTDKALFRLLALTYATVRDFYTVARMNALLEAALKRKADSRMVEGRAGNMSRLKRRNSFKPFHILLSMAATTISRHNISKWSTALQFAFDKKVAAAKFEDWVRQPGGMNARVSQARKHKVKPTLRANKARSLHVEVRSGRSRRE